MEKHRPAYDLAAIKAVLGAIETLAIIRTALTYALPLGFDWY